MSSVGGYLSVTMHEQIWQETEYMTLVTVHLHCVSTPVSESTACGCCPSVAKHEGDAPSKNIATHL